MYLTLQSSPFPCTSYINVHLRTPATLSSSETMMHSKIPLVGRLLLEIQFESQECIPVGCVPSAAVAVCWGVSALGVSAHGGCLPMGGCLPKGGVCPWGAYPSMHWGRHPPVNRMTDRCKNITFGLQWQIQYFPDRGASTNPFFTKYLPKTVSLAPPLPGIRHWFNFS